MDECETAVCPGENQQCENTEGSYRCICADGYKQMEGICVKEQIPGEPQEPGEGSSSIQGEGQQAPRLGSCRPSLPHPFTRLPWHKNPTAQAGFRWPHPSQGRKEI